MKKTVSVFTVILLSLWSCTESTLNSDQPKASGNIDEILLVTDTLTWQGETGESIRKAVKEAHPGVINPEPYFKITYFPEEHFGGIFTKHHFIFIPTTLERISVNPLLKKMVPDRVLDKVKKAETHILYKQKDVFAKGQTILFVISKEDYYLKNDFEKHKKHIQEVINNELMAKHAAHLLERPVNANIIKRLQGEHHISIHLPQHYDVALQENNLTWFRNVTEDADLNIFFTSKSYQGEHDFDSVSILSWRDNITKNYIFADKQDSSYMRREESIFPLIKTEVDSLSFSKYLWGLWNIKNRAMGGSFVSRIVKSPLNDKIYYIEGFVYAPGQEKLNYIRRLEAIIRTFEPGKLDE